MAGGFSFCGINIGSIGLEYAPELEDTYVYRSAAPRIHEETFDGHNGGYFYGISREPKEFKLRVFFEEKEIDRGLMAKVYHLFREGKSGKLIFDRRPWCYYYATVTNLDTTGITNYLNGLITIDMKAYYPFARSDMTYLERGNKDYNRICENTAFFEKAEMMPKVSLAEDGPITGETSFLLANPGTEMAHVGIEIAGSVGAGVTITNETTGQSCRFVAMNEADFDGEVNFLYLDGLNGKVSAITDGFSKPAFLYHDGGSIQLAPAYPATRNLLVAVRDGEILAVNKLYDRNIGETREDAEAFYKGQHIWLNNAWHEITGIGQECDPEDVQAYYANLAKSEHQILVADQLTEDSSDSTIICQLNKITVKPETTMKLTRLKFIYKPTFA